MLLAACGGRVPAGPGSWSFDRYHPVVRLACRYRYHEVFPAGDGAVRVPPEVWASLLKPWAGWCLQAGVEDRTGYDKYVAAYGRSRWAFAAELAGAWAAGGRTPAPRPTAWRRATARQTAARPGLGPSRSPACGRTPGTRWSATSSIS